MTFKYNKVFIKKLKMKMPKLTSIKFDGNMILPETQETSTTNDETEEIDFTLDNVSSIEVFKGNIKNHKDWIIYSLPNLRNLILDFSNFPSIRNELCPILNKRIERLDIYSDYDFKQLTKSYVYFSNVEHIFIYFVDFVKYKFGEDVVEMLTRFKNLKTLFIFSEKLLHLIIYFHLDGGPRKYFKYFDKNEIMKDYEVKYSEKYCLFLKREFNDSGVDDNLPVTSRIS